MKAAEYAQRITDAALSGNESAMREAIEFVVLGMANEGVAMFAQRGMKAGAGIAREMDAKWRAIANRCPPKTLNPNGWRDFMVNQSPELAELFAVRRRG